MYGIGTVARLAQVSVRTLRHYDDDVSVDQMRGILLLRQAEARSRLATQTEQLKRVETRLAQLEEAPMAGYEVIVKALDPVRVVAMSADLTEASEIGEAAGRLYPQLHAALDDRGIVFGGLSFALYEETSDPQRPLRLTTALPVPDGVTIDGDGLTTIDVPAVERAATTVVRGAPDQFPDAFRAIHEWVARTGNRAITFEREVYIDCDGPTDTWVTELQTVLGPEPG